METGFRLNKEYILTLVRQYGWSQGKFALMLNMTKSPVNKWINGTAPESLTLIKAIVKLFPDEPLDKLFIR